MTPEQRLEIQRRLWDASSLGSKPGVLDLSHMGLESLPLEVIAQATGCTTLDLSNNSLTTLPSELREISQLQTINLTNNRLTTLPKALVEFRRLKEVILTGNTTLPPQMLKKSEEGLSGLLE